MFDPEGSSKRLMWPSLVVEFDVFLDATGDSGVVDWLVEHIVNFGLC
jgi:hypothetical protein